MSKRKPRLHFPSGVWRPVVGFEGYYWVSDDGRLFTQPRTGSSGGLLKVQRAKTGGYPIYRFYRPGLSRTRTVHKVLMEAFVGPCPNGMEVRHIDGDVTNCTLANLAYGTPSQNEYDKVRHGTHHEARKTHCPQGHPYDEANTYVLPSRPRARYCRKCAADRKRKRRAALRVPQVAILPPVEAPESGAVAS